MKAIKNIMSLMAVLLLGISFFACSDDIDTRQSNKGDGKSIRLTLSVPDNIVVNPMTKSAPSLSQSVTNMTVLIYDTDGGLLKSIYYDESTNFTALNENGSYVTESIELGDKVSGSVYVVANAGNLSDTTLEDLKTMSFGLNSNNPQMVMCASGDVYPTDPKTGLPTYTFSGISFNTESNSNITAELVRIYSQVTVSMVSETDPDKVPLKENLVITPKSVRIYNVPTKGSLSGPNKITSEAGSQREGELLKTKALGGKWDPSSTEQTEVFYLYENMQPQGYCGKKENGDKDQTSKTPKSFGEATTNTSLLKGDRLSSYIEVEAEYKYTNTTSEPGKIIYRFFLGNDPYDNFSIQRNVNYKITLTLHGDGGADEATWRVETEKIPGKINVSDLYVSFLGGSSSEMVVTGDVAGIKGTEMENLYNPNSDNEAGGFSMSEIRRNEKEMVLKFTAQSTNVHDYREKTVDVRFKVENSDKDYVVRVHQVPRLVDPIAFYKKASNDQETRIEVKRFNAGDLDNEATKGKYEILESKGPWTAEISSGDWYDISTIDRSQSVRGESNKITGEGPIIFNYKPEGPNDNADGDGGPVDGARFGKITVYYHNNWCKHEIFLRQGYQPTILGDEEYAWSSFNCLGKKGPKDEYGSNTEYPTQTGWLFNGGVDVAMNPYNPGYKKSPQSGSSIEYLDGKTHDYGYLLEDKGSDTKKYTSWQQRDAFWGSFGNGTGFKEVNLPRTAKSRQGPCPKGYIVADAWTYENMVKNKSDMAVYTGYVHDDSPSDTPSERGWDYLAMMNGENPEIYTNNNCNPAKGSLFVHKGDAKNVFFNYGKGLVADQKDHKLLNEIGVGHRTNGSSFVNLFGWLQYSDNNGYGAYYWNATPFIVGSMGKIDFSYNIFSSEPNPIDVPGRYSFENKEHAAIGINVFYNASFVRCVKDPKPTEYVIFDLSKAKITLNGQTPGMGTQLKITALGTIESVQDGVYSGEFTTPITLPKVANYQLEMNNVKIILIYEQLLDYCNNGGTINIQ